MSGNLESHLRNLPAGAFSFATCVADCSGNMCNSQPPLRPSSLLKGPQISPQSTLSNAFYAKDVSSSSGLRRQTRYSPSQQKIAEISMPRVAFRLRIKAGNEREYDVAHRNVWPALLAKLEEVGISNYSIFRREQDLFLVMQVDDFDAAWRAPIKILRICSGRKKWRCSSSR